MPPRAPVLLAYVQADAAPVVRSATHRVGAEPLLAESLASALASLRSDRPALVLVSLAAEHADAPLIARIADAVGPGRVLVSTPDGSLAGSIEAVRAGAAAVL